MISGLSALEGDLYYVSFGKKHDNGKLLKVAFVCVRTSAWEAKLFERTGEVASQPAVSRTEVGPLESQESSVVTHVRIISRTVSVRSTSSFLRCDYAVFMKSVCIHHIGTLARA